MKHSLGKETSKKRKRINEIRTCEHFDTGAMLYQLRWKSNSGVEGHFCRFCDCNKDKDDKMLRLRLSLKKKRMGERGMQKKGFSSELNLYSDNGKKKTQKRLVSQFVAS